MFDDFDDEEDYDERLADAHEKQQLAPQTIFAWTCFIGLAASFIFVGFPDIDLWAGKLFLIGERTFIFNVSETGPFIRNIFKAMFVLVCLATLAGLAYSILSTDQLLGLTFPKWLFVTASLIIGPGLITNVILKDNWGRARPLHIEQFGGAQKFTPALVRSDQCEDNCSFVSGESSSIYAVFFIFAFLIVHKRKQLIKGGIIAGTVAGIVRMAQGGHFLSDVILSGVFMMLVVLALHWLIFTRFASALKENGWVHSYLALTALTGERKVKKFAKSKGWNKLIRQSDDELS